MQPSSLFAPVIEGHARAHALTSHTREGADAISAVAGKQPTDFVPDAVSEYRLKNQISVAVQVKALRVVFLEGGDAVRLERGSLSFCCRLGYFRVFDEVAAEEKR